MAKDPAVLFYTSDFISGTLTMTDEQKGKYITLLCLQHQKGRLTEKHMLSICKAYDKDIFEKFKIDKDGLYYNVRLEDETIRRKKYTQSRRKNAKGKGKAYAKHMETETETIIENKDITENKIDFEIFWNLYNKKRGDKSKIEKKWDKLNIETQQKIIDYIPKYIKSQPDKKYRKDPQTFLNNKSWNDEIIENNNLDKDYDKYGNWIGGLVQ